MDPQSIAEYKASLMKELRPLSEIEKEEDYIWENTGAVQKYMFTKEVELLVWWCEDDHTGEINSLYRFAGKYFIINRDFGSCSGCDEWQRYSEIRNSTKGQEYGRRLLEEMVAHAEVAETARELLLGEYAHPEWRTRMSEFVERVERESVPCASS